MKKAGSLHEKTARTSVSRRTTTPNGNPSPSRTDWAIYGPFSIENDKQKVAITQDGQKEALEHAGRTGGLPFVGVGWYRLNFEAPAFSSGKKATLIFDGAMSHARVYINGQEAGFWPYGYNSFHIDATPYLKAGEQNTLAVRLENETVRNLHAGIRAQACTATFIW